MSIPKHSDDNLLEQAENGNNYAMNNLVICYNKNGDKIENCKVNELLYDNVRV